jgi:ribonuclease HII
MVAASGLWQYEAAVRRSGFTSVAGADEAGRGACAGPLVVAACVLPDRGRIAGLDDSKALTPAARERLFPRIQRRAISHAVVVIPPEEIDRYGLHVANIAGMRRAVAQLAPAPDYALTDGFAVAGLAIPATAVWKGDAVVACIAAASILAKVTRDRIMTELHEQWPEYDFAQHKGYVTPEHAAALSEHGPSPVHRYSYVNVRRAMGEDVFGPNWIGVARGEDNEEMLAGERGPILASSVGELSSVDLLTAQEQENPWIAGVEASAW